MRHYDCIVPVTLLYYQQFEPGLRYDIMTLHSAGHTGLRYDSMALKQFLKLRYIEIQQSGFSSSDSSSNYL